MIMLTALYLLYRIAFPKSPEAKTGSDIPANRETDADDCVKKSRDVSACRRQPQPTPATNVNSDFQAEKPSIFASRNEKTDAVIPPGKLDEVFGEDPGPEDLDIDPDDENETDSPDWDGEEESEELRLRDQEVWSDQMHNVACQQLYQLIPQSDDKRWVVEIPQRQNQPVDLDIRDPEERRHNRKE